MKDHKESAQYPVSVPSSCPSGASNIVAAKALHQWKDKNKSLDKSTLKCKEQERSVRVDVMSKDQYQYHDLSLNEGPTISKKYVVNMGPHSERSLRKEPRTSTIRNTELS